MNRYHRIEIKERIKIYELKIKGFGISEIGRILGRDKGTISRELKRNSSLRLGFYHPLEADEEAKARRKRRRSKIDMDDKLKTRIIARLKDLHSPEQIAGRLRIEGIKICHETIYQFIYKGSHGIGDLYKLLRFRHIARFKRGARKMRIGKIPYAISIHERPKSVDNRNISGHFEADLMMTHNGRSDNLLVLVERKTRAAFIAHNKSKHADNIADKIKAFCEKIRVKSITFDNGKEFSRHFSLGVKTYFCDTHSPWQKGTVENTISRIRHLYNKFNGDPIMIQNHLNNTPRKILGFKTPNELFNLFTNRCTTI